jgi:spore germination protein
MVIDSFDTHKGKAMIAYVDGLVDKDLIDRDVIMPLKSANFDGNVNVALKATYKKIMDIPTCTEQILSGNTAVFYEGNPQAWVLEMRGWEKRAVEEPAAESSSAAEEGFTENNSDKHGSFTKED